MSIVADQLTKTYGSQRAADGVSFSIEQGEVVGFLGPNGAGKSTTMKMLTGFVRPTAGRAVVCGEEVSVDDRSARRHIGYLPENNPLYHDLYVLESLRFTAGLHGLSAPASRIDAVIELTGLERERHKRIGQLSKGYKQRVGLAQALLHDPEVLILDEPTSGLDPNQLADIRALIRDIGRAKTVLLSTHVMQEVEAMCHRVLIIDRGVLVADDAVGSIRADQEGRHRVRFKLTQDVGDTLGPWTVTHRDDGFLEIRDAGDDLAERLFAHCAAHDLTLRHLEAVRPALEDTFKELTTS